MALRGGGWPSREERGAPQAPWPSADGPAGRSEAHRKRLGVRSALGVVARTQGLDLPLMSGPRRVHRRRVYLGGRRLLSFPGCSGLLAGLFKRALGERHGAAVRVGQPPARPLPLLGDARVRRDDAAARLALGGVRRGH